MNKLLPTLLFLLVTFALRGQQKVIPLYPGAAPGSENWTWSETESDKNMYHANAIYNISKPTLTVYLPDSSHPPTGMAIIVVEHLMGFIEQITDRVIVMNAGKEIFEGKLAVAVKVPQVIEVFLGGEHAA